VSLVVSKEELLMVVKSRVGEFVGTGMEMFCMDRASSSSSVQQLQAQGVLVDHHEWSDFMVPII